MTASRYSELAPLGEPNGMTQDSPSEWVGRVASGDRGAFEKLYRSFGPALLGILARILGDRREAEDVLHEVFLQVWRGASKFNARRGSTFAWLSLIARSRALDRLARKSARTRPSPFLFEATRPREIPDPAEEASLSEERDRLRDGLTRLPAVQQRVLLLAYFGGFSQTEIAERLALPLGTVKSHARIGLRRLRDSIVDLPSARASKR